MEGEQETQWAPVRTGAAAKSGAGIQNKPIAKYGSAAQPTKSRPRKADGSLEQSTLSGRLSYLSGVRVMASL